MLSLSLLAGDDDNETTKLKEYMKFEYEIEDLGALRYFLGIEVSRSKQGITILQRKYTLNLREEIDKLGAVLVDIPIEQNRGLLSHSWDLLNDPGSYQRLVGS